MFFLIRICFGVRIVVETVICKHLCDEWRKRFEFKNVLYNKIVDFEMSSKFYIGHSFVRTRFGGRVARVEVTNGTNYCVI